MKIKFILCLLLSLPVLNISAQQRLGHESAASWQRIQEINSDLSMARGIGGLFAVYGLLQTDAPGGIDDEAILTAEESIRNTAGTDGDDYQNTADFINSFDQIRRRAILDEIDRLRVLDETSGNQLLTDEERNFWNRFEELLNRERTNADGSSVGDPHYLTFDGYFYFLQSVGEFTLCKDATGQFEVQVRTKAVTGNTAANSAVAIKVHGQQVAFYNADFPDGNPKTPIWINGRPVEMRKTFLRLKHGGAIKKVSPNQYLVYCETGEKVFVNFYQYVDVTVNVPKKKYRTTGLLGNNNGIKDDDLKDSKGVPLQAQSWKKEIGEYIDFNKPSQRLGAAEKAFYEQLSKKFADSWRVTSTTTLFTYGPGKSTTGFNNKKYPMAYNSFTDLTPAQIDRARTACKDAGVNDQDMQGCIYDVAFSQQSFFARSNATLTKTKTLLNSFDIQTPLNKIPTIREARSKLKQKIKNIKLPIRKH